MTITVTAIGQTNGDVLTVDNEEGVWKTPTVTTVNLGVSNKTGTTLDITSSAGTSATLPSATGSEAGLFSASDQAKLAGIEAGAVAAGADGDAFAVAHLLAFAHGDIATALQPGDVGTAAYASTGDFAPVAKGVTNGDSHDHAGGDGAQIAYSGLAGIPSTFAPANHDHASNKLAQANTHEVADTDTATSALHHTIGTGANNAAAGNHTHAGIYEPVLTAASQAEMETGTETALRSMSPLRVAQAISALGGTESGNVIINGCFRVWQLGTSFVTPAHYDITADRWVWGQSSGTATWTITRSTDIPSALFGQYSLDIDCTGTDTSIAAADESHIRYAVEGYDFAPFVGKAATLGFWVKSNVTGTHCIAFSNTSSDRSMPKEYTISSANTWEYKEIQVTFDYSGGTWNYTNGLGLKIRFALVVGSTYQGTNGVWASANLVGTANQQNLAASTSNYLRIAGVTLGLGSVAPSPAVVDHIADVIQKCKRYLVAFSCTTGGVNIFTGPASTTGGVNFDVYVGEMRSAPTIKLVGSYETDYAIVDVAATVIAATVTITAYTRSVSYLKLTATKSGAFTIGAIYQFRLITTTGLAAAVAELYG